jgi:uncharacterized protein
MRKIELEIAGLSHTVTQSQSYAVLLSEVGGLRKLPIVIGAFEAQAIAVAVEKVVINRPLSHDLIKNIFTVFQIQLKEIIIDNLQDGIFYSKLLCEKDGLEMEIDSRTSDALALAVRFSCPIYTYEFILDTAGTVLKDPEKEGFNEAIETAEQLTSQSSKLPDFSRLTLKELQDKLSEMLEKEDYEAAARIRDEIDIRSKK